MRFVLQPSEKPNYWVCTDTENKIVCVFENRNFNYNQKLTTLDDFNPENVMLLAKFARGMGDWLQANHYDKIF